MYREPQRTLIFLAIGLAGFLGGWFLSSYGPLIPFYSRSTGKDETHYSYIMLSRSLGLISGLFASKYLPDIFTTKAILIESMAASILFFYLNTLSMSDANLFVTYFMMSIHSIVANAVGIGVIFQLYPDSAAFYIQLRGFIFGVGALIGPQIVTWFELDNFIILAITNVLPLIIFAAYPIPNIQTKQQVKLSLQKSVISMKAELMICGLMFAYAGMENGLASWIPTYAIKSGVSEIEGSSFYSLLFWLPNCFSRLLWIFMPGTVFSKLSIAMKLVALSTSLSVLLQLMGFSEAVCIFAPLSSGLILANIDSFCISLPSDHGFESTNSNTAHFMLANAAAEGLVNMPIGYLIRTFGHEALIIAQLALAIASLLVVKTLGQRLDWELMKGKQGGCLKAQQQNS